MDSASSQLDPRAEDVADLAFAKRWTRPWWTAAWLLALVWGLMLAYGTLMPFDFAIGKTVADAGGWPDWFRQGVIAALSWHPYPPLTSSLGVPVWMSDLVANLVLYLPLGVLVRVAVDRPHRSWPIQVGVVLFVCGMLSFSLELTQTLMPTRYASLNDVLANTGAGLLGGLLAGPARHGWRRAAFVLYCRVAARLHPGMNWLRAQRRKPAIIFAIVVVDIAILGAWVFTITGGKLSFGEANTSVSWMPFAVQFERDYDVAGLMLGRSLMLWMLVASLLSITFFRPRQRKSLGIVVLLLACCAAAQQGLSAATGGARPDITEPILAIIALGFVLVLVFLFAHAVRSSCRRKEERPVENDRRRRPHAYR